MLCVCVYITYVAMHVLSMLSSVVLLTNTLAVSTFLVD